MRHRHPSVVAIPALLALYAAGAHAQDVQNFKPAVGTWNYLSVEGARVAKHAEFVPSLYLNYGHDPLVVRDASDDSKIQTTIVKHLATADVLFAVGLLDRLEIGVDIPVSYVKGDLLEQTNNEGVGIGDIRVIPKIRLFGLEKGRGFGAAISAPLAFPTGDKDKAIGEDQFTANPKLILEARALGFSFAANGGVRFRPDERKLQSLDVKNEVTYGAGVSVDLGTENVVAMAEVFGATPISDVSTDSRANPLEGLLGLRIFTHAGPVFTLGGGTGIVADYGAPEYRLLAGIAYHDRNYDRDKDGILDENDKCPDDPEDKDGFQDLDGCPDPDNDADGIPDAQDSCPNDAEDKDGFEDQDGCPDPDNDQDGKLDAEDKCPNEPENYNQWEDADGCPDTIPDTDGDGLLDPQDKCPHDAEDKDGFEDADGCPDLDNDKDGIPDTADKCPMDPETINGFEDEDGCPDQGPTRVRVTREKIEILDKVYFETNKAIIKPISYSLLDQVALVIKAHPYIKKIRVEGHTDSVGNDAYNLKLSQARAESVQAYLINKGVDASRLEATGYGETKPVDTNNTAEGRANNRRVEFTILEQELQGEQTVPGQPTPPAPAPAH
jgi:outer membrane protein OmpA-like peptidoglycan-associated protein